jgi:dTDP-4-amino-4,6-dideoxygalactose transaminase
MWILQDSCHSPGGYFKDSKGIKQSCGNGKFAELAIFSFHPVKHIAAGEGGMITTNDKKLYERLLMLRSHGIQQNPKKRINNHGCWYYEMQELGFNYRLTDIQAALGLSQLNRAASGITKRKKIANIYYNAFKNSKFIKGQSGIIDGHAYHLYVVEFEYRNGLINFLRDLNVYAQVHYIPMHLMPYYQNLGWKEGDFPHVEKYYKHCLSLPIHTKLTENEQSFVIDSIFDFYKKN